MSTQIYIYIFTNPPASGDPNRLAMALDSNPGAFQIRFRDESTALFEGVVKLLPKRAKQQAVCVLV